MTTRLDEGPEHDPDDPLAVLLRPAHGLLEPPPGRFEEIRRAAGRRKLLRAAGGAGLTCALALLVTLALHPAAGQDPAPPVGPLAPPPAGAPTPDRTGPPAVTGSPSRPSPSSSASGARRPSPSTPPGERPALRSGEPGAHAPRDTRAAQRPTARRTPPQRTAFARPHGGA